MQASLPLSGIKVVDFSQAMAGPSCTMLLADFGAEVTKIEPLGGDNARKWGSARYGAGDQFSSQYLALNRNKNSVAIDLKNAEGLALARRLVNAADVLVENFKPGVMTRLGLGFEELAISNPGLVYCSISGFGQTGPLSSRPGFDQLMQAYAGLLSVTGEPDRTSVRIGPSSIDMLTGSNAAIGILVALRERDRSGAGQWVDTSLYEASLHMMTHMIVDYTGTGKMTGKTGGNFPFLAPYGIFDGSDREFYIGVSNQKMWARFCDALDRKDLFDDPRFSTNGNRSTNQLALYEILRPIFRTQPARYWYDLAERLEIPTSLLHDLSEVVVQEQALAREAVIHVAGGHADIRSAGLPIKLSRTPGSVRKPPPELAADAAMVFGELGLTAEDLDHLRGLGVIV